VLRQRVAAALAGAVPSVVRARGRWSQRFARPLLGVGIAATVAVVAIGALRSLNEAALAPSGVVPIAITPLQADSAIAAPSYIVPQEVDEARAGTPPTLLTNYLILHGEYASGLTRTTVNSNVVGAATDNAARETAVSKPLVVEQEALQ
jgi:hypothetical protein